MKSSKQIVVQIQHCQNCHLHSWCSRHDQNKYKQHLEKVRANALNIFGNVKFITNQPQRHYQEICQPSSKGQTKYFDHQNQTTVNFPRFGSFQIFVNGNLIFSKLQSNLWPKHDRISGIFQKIKNQIQNQNQIEKFSIQYRMKHDNDEYFRQTYKKLIQKKNIDSQIVRSFSQNRSQVLSMGNRSPSNNIKLGNSNFISRKLHQSLKKQDFAQLQLKHEFIKSYKAQSRSNSKGLKRPVNNQLSRGKRKINIQFNPVSQNYQLGSEQLKQESNFNTENIHSKGSPNPRKRLQILRDNLVKPTSNKNNSPLGNYRKQPLNVKNHIRKITSAKTPSQGPAKIGNIQKLSPKTPNNIILIQQNNWMTNNSPSNKGQQSLSINSVQKPENGFKKISLKNQKKRKLSSQNPAQTNNKAQKVPQLQNFENSQDNLNRMVENKQQNLIAKMKAEDKKQQNKGFQVKVESVIQQSHEAMKKSIDSKYKQQKNNKINRQEKEVQQIEQRDYIIDDQGQQQEQNLKSKQTQKISKLQKQQIKVQLNRKYNIQKTRPYHGNKVQVKQKSTQQLQNQPSKRSQKQEVEKQEQQQYENLQEQFEAQQPIKQQPKVTKKVQPVEKNNNLTKQQQHRQKKLFSSQFQSRQILKPKNNLESSYKTDSQKQSVKNEQIQQYQNEFEQNNLQSSSKLVSKNKSQKNQIQGQQQKYQQQLLDQEQQRKKSTSIENSFNSNKNHGQFSSPSNNYSHKDVVNQSSINHISQQNHPQQNYSYQPYQVNQKKNNYQPKSQINAWSRKQNQPIQEYQPEQQQSNLQLNKNQPSSNNNIISRQANNTNTIQGNNNSISKISNVQPAFKVQSSITQFAKDTPRRLQTKLLHQQINKATSNYVSQANSEEGQKSITTSKVAKQQQLKVVNQQQKVEGQNQKVNQNKQQQVLEEKYQLGDEEFQKQFVVQKVEKQLPIKDGEKVEEKQQEKDEQEAPFEEKVIEEQTKQHKNKLLQKEITKEQKIHKLVQQPTHIQEKQQQQKFQQQVLQQQIVQKQSKIQKRSQSSQKILEQPLQQVNKRPVSRDSRTQNHRKCDTSIITQPTNKQQSTIKEQQNNHQSSSKRDFTKKSIALNQQQANTPKNNAQYQTNQSPVQKFSSRQSKIQQPQQQTPLQQQIQKPHQSKQQNYEQQQQLSQAQQSHRSIPIIVSTNEGTSKIIQDEVHRELEEMYLREQQEREQRERILQGMMENSGKDIEQQPIDTNNEKYVTIKQAEEVKNQQNEQQKYSQQNYQQQHKQQQSAIEQKKQQTNNERQDKLNTANKNEQILEIDVNNHHEQQQQLKIESIKQQNKPVVVQQQLAHKQAQVIDKQQIAIQRQEQKHVQRVQSYQQKYQEEVVKQQNVQQKQHRNQFLQKQLTQQQPTQQRPNNQQPLQVPTQASLNVVKEYANKLDQNIQIPMTEQAISTQREIPNKHTNIPSKEGIPPVSQNNIVSQQAIIPTQTSLNVVKDYMNELGDKILTTEKEIDNQIQQKKENATFLVEKTGNEQQQIKQVKQEQQMVNEVQHKQQRSQNLQQQNYEQQKYEPQQQQVKETIQQTANHLIQQQQTKANQHNAKTQTQNQQQPIVQQQQKGQQIQRLEMKNSVQQQEQKSKVYATKNEVEAVQGKNQNQSNVKLIEMNKSDENKGNKQYNKQQNIQIQVDIDYKNNKQNKASQQNRLGQHNTINQQNKYEEHIQDKLEKVQQPLPVVPIQEGAIQRMQVGQIERQQLEQSKKQQQNIKPQLVLQESSNISEPQVKKQQTKAEAEQQSAHQHNKSANQAQNKQQPIQSIQQQSSVIEPQTPIVQQHTKQKEVQKSTPQNVIEVDLNQRQPQNPKQTTQQLIKQNIEELNPKVHEQIVEQQSKLQNIVNQKLEKQDQQQKAIQQTNENNAQVVNEQIKTKRVLQDKKQLSKQKLINDKEQPTKQQPKHDQTNTNEHLDVSNKVIEQPPVINQVESHAAVENTQKLIGSEIRIMNSDIIEKIDQQNSVHNGGNLAQIKDGDKQIKTAE